MFFTVRTYLPATIWLITATILLLLPGDQLPRDSWFQFLYMDKLVHIGFFFLLVLLFSLPGPASLNRIAAITFMAIAYGIGIEFIQRYWIPGRSFDQNDIYADALGAIAGGIMARVAGKR